jgi:hypothetical protein
VETCVAQLANSLPESRPNRVQWVSGNGLWRTGSVPHRRGKELLGAFDAGRQAVLAGAFRGELTADWRSANNRDFARTWRTETLGNLALDVRYGTAAKCHYEPRATPVLRIPNVAAGRIDIRDLKYGVFGTPDIKKLSLKEGDLLVIRSNGSPDLVGRVAVVDTQAVGYLFAGYLIRMRLDETKVLPDFVSFAFEAPSIRSMVSGGRLRRDSVSVPLRPERTKCPRGTHKQTGSEHRPDKPRIRARFPTSMLISIRTGLTDPRDGISLL